MSERTTVAPGAAGVTTDPRAAHRRAVRTLRESYARIPPGRPVRLAKATSNLFRFRDPAGAPGLDVSDFDAVIHVNPLARTADVQGMTTYESLVRATLPFGLMPAVVPQLKTITLGGAVTGLGIESSSFRHGLPHESVQEVEILTGAGEVVTATRDNEHRELFHGFPNSYGTLGYALRLTIELEPVKPYVWLRHVRFDDARDCAAALADICSAHSYDGAPVHFLDGTVFERGELYLTLGAFVDEAPYVSDYTGQRIFYRSIRERAVDHLTVHDYLWRWDTDWFWCSRALGAQHPLLRRAWPRSARRSDVYRRIVALDKQMQMSARIDRWRGLPPREDVIQDVEIPVERLPEFLDFFSRDIGIKPVWLCPVQLRERADPDSSGRGASGSSERGESSSRERSDSGPGERSDSGPRRRAPWPLYPLEPDRLYINVGFWSSVPLAPGRLPDHHNRLIERKVAELGGHKSLYSTSFYTEEEFWRRYDGATYRRLKGSYDPDGRLLDLYGKCVRGR
jgi:FAD/FMN-containing dehydrogenase